jgi:DNA replication protein DnaC
MMYDPADLHARRQLDESDYQFICVPHDLWHCQLAGVQESVRSKVERFVHNAVPWLCKGMGMWVFGPPGVGKSGIAALLTKVAFAHRFDARFVSVAHLQEDIRHRRAYEDDQPALIRAQEVCFLALDDLTSQDATNPVFGATALSSFLALRASHQRPTVVTTQMSQRQVEEVFPGILGRSRYKMPFLIVEGHNLRALEEQKAQQLLDGGA